MISQADCSHTGMKLLAAVLIIFNHRGLYASHDYFSVTGLGLTVRPGNQEDLAEYYPEKLDDNAGFIFTPGIALTFDKSFQSDYFSHIRITGGGFKDCAAVPAGYIAGGGLMNILNGRSISIQFCAGLAFYARENRENKLGYIYHVFKR